MSIITEALKRAEQDREQKAKRDVGLQELTSFLGAEEKAVEALIEKRKTSEPKSEEDKPAPHASSAVVIDFSKLFHFSFTAVQKKVLVVGIVGALFLTLLLAPNWKLVSQQFSLAGFFLGNSKTSKMASTGIIYDQGAYRTSARTDNFSAAQSSRLPFQLTGISLVGEDHFAVINGLIVQKGDSVDGAYVKEIMGREVVLETRTGEIKLKITS